MMIVTMWLFLLITLGVLFYGFFIRKPEMSNENAYYKIAYQEQKQQLDEQLAQQAISQAMYDEQFTLISREFLNRSSSDNDNPQDKNHKKHKKNNKQENKKNNKKNVGLFLFIGLIPALVLFAYWAFVYTAEGYNFFDKESSTKKANIIQVDQAYADVSEIVDSWLTRIKNEKLVYEDDIANLKPPKELEAKYAEIIQTLQRKLAKEGLQDVEGLKLLGTLYFNVQAYGMAQTIYEQIETLTPDDSQVALTLAQLDIANNNGEMTAIARQYFDKAIKLSPNNDTPVMMYALNLANAGLYEEALKKWHWLEGRYTSSSPVYPFIQKAISGIENKMKAKSQAKSIEVTIQADENLVQNLPTDATLYVFAKPSQAGSPPFLVKRVAITQFPMIVTLNDDDKMSRDAKNLNEYDDVMVSARISLTGNATPAVNDIEANAANVTMQEAKVNLRLDHRR